MQSRTLAASLLAFLVGAAVAVLAFRAADTPSGSTASPASSGPATVADVDPDNSASRSPHPRAAHDDRAAPRAQSGDDEGSSLQRRIAESRRTAIVRAVERAAPSVASVDILVRQTVTPFGSVVDPRRREFFERMFPFRREIRRFPAGSAVVISADGEIVTNEHVVRAADAVFVTLPDGRETQAEVVGTSRRLDLALLRVGLDGLRAAPLGDSESLVVGEWLVAIGYPVATTLQGFQPSVTVGVASATRRDFRPQRTGQGSSYYTDMIQTDAAINPGNSGGPLANAGGEIVGLNTFILSEGGGSEGLGFAIPMSRVLRAVDEIREHGRVRNLDFGFRAQQIDSRIARGLGLDAARGIVVTRVGSAGPADDAGLRREDVILDIDGKPVNTIEDAEAALNSRFVGDRVTLGVWRDGERLELELRLGAASG